MSTSIISSIVTGGTNDHATISEEANAYATDFITPGVLGTITNTGGIAPTTGSFGVNQDTGSDMAISILGSGNTTNGQAIAYVSVTPSSQNIQVLRARMASNYTDYVINANSSGSTKYDWIYLEANATNANVPDSAADNVFSIYTSRSTSNTADNGSPPTFGIPLAIVTVANGATAITNSNIKDIRTQTILSGGSSFAWTSWTPTWTGMTIGNATVSANYVEIGKFVAFNLSVTLGNTSSVTSNPVFSTPTTMAHTPANTNSYNVGSGAISLSAGNTVMFANAQYNSTTTAIIALYFISGGVATYGGITSTAPFTWTTGSCIDIHGFYQSA